MIAEPDQAPAYVYFPESCVASMVNPTDEGAVEVGTIGSEGMVGLSIFLDAEAVPSRMIWQVPGQALRIPVPEFLRLIGSLPELTRLLRRYTHAFFVQVAQTAACNRMHEIDRRCARWLLMTHDRVAGADTFVLTQEFLAFMLGVRRAGVSEAATALQKRGLISYARGKVNVIDRAGLEAASCECYEIVRSHHARALNGAAHAGAPQFSPASGNDAGPPPPWELA